MKSVNILLIILFIFFLPFKARPSSPSEFLLSDVDARTHAIGAYAADLNSSSFNRMPSLLADSKSIQANSTFGFRPEGTKSVQLFLVYPLARTSFGVHLGHWIHPAESFTDETGQTKGEFRNTDLAVTFSAASGYSRTKLGLSATAIRKKLASSSAIAFSLTPSLHFDLLSRLSLGFGVTDLTVLPLKLGKSRENFPTQFRTGLKIKVLELENLGLDFLTDFVHSGSESLESFLGSEVKLNDSLYVRAAMSPNHEDVRAGIGVRVAGLQLDWSTQFGSFSYKDFMNISLTYKFDEKK